MAMAMAKRESKEPVALAPAKAGVPIKIARLSIFDNLVIELSKLTAERRDLMAIIHDGQSRGINDSRSDERLNLLNERIAKLEKEIENLKNVEQKQLAPAIAPVFSDTIKKIIEQAPKALVDLMESYLLEPAAQAWFQEAYENGVINFRGIGFLLSANFNYIGSDGYTVLMQAAMDGRNDIVKVLLEYEAEVDYHPSGTDSPIIIAAREHHFEVVKLLINNGADVNERSIIIGSDVLFGIQGKGWTGRTSLHFAAEAGDIEAIKFLLKHGADINAQDARGETPLMVAEDCGKYEVADYLLEQFQDDPDAFDIKDNEGMRIIDRIKKKGDVERIARYEEEEWFSDDDEQGEDSIPSAPAITRPFATAALPPLRAGLPLPSSAARPGLPTPAALPPSLPPLATVALPALPTGLPLSGSTAMPQPMSPASSSTTFSSSSAYHPALPAATQPPRLSSGLPGAAIPQPPCHTSFVTSSLAFMPAPVERKEAQGATLPTASSVPAKTPAKR